MWNLERKRVGLLCVGVIFVIIGCAGRNELSGEPTVIRKKIILSAEKMEPESGIAFDEPEKPPYDPTGRIDPFKPFVTIATGDDDGRKTVRPVDLSRYTLTGVILAPGGNRALIRDASGKGLVVSEGENLGRSDSVKIAKILKNRVLVDTVVEDDFKPGTMSTIQRELKLQKPFSESHEYSD